MLYCGIDVAKHKHAVALLDEQGQKIQPVFAVENSRDGLDRLGETLALLDGPILVGLEATGHYWLSLYEVLSSQGYGVVVLNPMQVAAYRKSGIRKIKTDNTDAAWIADFVRIANLPAARRDVPVLLQLRELSRFRYWLSDQIGDCKRKLLTILDRVFPEYESLFSSVFLQSSRTLLQEAVSAQEFASFDLQELTQLLSRSSRGHFGAEKAEELQSQAKQSIGVSFLVNAARLELHCLLAQMELIEQQQDQVEQALAQLMQQIPQHITSIPGIGLATGAAILAEIGDITRFASPDKLVAYAGIDATVYQTGQFEASHAHMSKRGSPYLRHALWQAACMAIRYDEELKAFYQRKRTEGKHHNVALGAVCRKLLDRIFIILKEQRPYVIR
jgi:transposase